MSENLDWPQDMSDYFESLAPPDERSSSPAARPGARRERGGAGQRPESPEEAQRRRGNGRDIDNVVELQKWRDQEPTSAHSHLLPALAGSSESAPAAGGGAAAGQRRSALLAGLGGPR